MSDEASGPGRGDYQELRLAMVFNGGVSLAVWMGGVAKELDRFRTAFYRNDAVAQPYKELLDAVRTEVHTDVIAGTSAGGINGALLGYAVANGTTLENVGAQDGSDPIRDLWQNPGPIEALPKPEGAPEPAPNHKPLSRAAAGVSKAPPEKPPLASTPPCRVRLTVT